jgi:hypothetical protein
MQLPFGQGAMFQAYFEDISPMLSRLTARRWPIYLGPREVWREVGDREAGQREVFIQDPDGYQLMLAQSIGERPIVKSSIAPLSMGSEPVGTRG